ncbi:unnamed protein product [Sphagnum balticum]
MLNLSFGIDLCGDGMSRNDWHNSLITEVVFFQGTPAENALGMSALTPLTIERGMVQFTEDWFAYDNATAMWTWLEEANWTELFGPTFENVGPWQLVKSSRDWIAPWACTHVSEETEIINPHLWQSSKDQRKSAY